MAGEESPFERVPASSRTEPSSGYTYEGQLERVGELATGLRSRPSGTRLAVQILIIAILAVIVFASLSAAAVIGFRLVVG
jgi:hypothetical protein